MFRRYKDILTLLAGVILGTFISFTTTLVLAHGGNTAKLHTCVDDTTGAMRMVGENDTCPGGEHNVDWDQDAMASVSNNIAPYICTIKCNLSNFAPALKGKNFSYAQISGLQLVSVDMSGTNFSNSNISGSFSGTNLTNVNFTDAILTVSFSETNLQSANFTNANLTDADFNSATNMDTATLTGVTWSNTICPDGTNSDNNSNTCVDHFTPFVPEP
jgi:Pentapeptide repeats (9 copies)